MEQQKYKTFLAVLELLELLYALSDRYGLVCYKLQGELPTPEPEHFQLASGIVLLAHNGHVHTMLTPWGRLKFFIQVAGKLEQSFPRLDPDDLVVRPMPTITGLEDFMAYAVVSVQNVVLPEPRIQSPESFLRPVDAMTEWWNRLAERKVALSVGLKTMAQPA